MKLWDYLNGDKLERYVCDGLVNMRLHKSFPLSIFSYSRKTVRENLWDDITEKCRGLIVNIDTGEIIARPFEKFFNYATAGRPETQPENLPTTLPMILQKLDGNLGIRYTYQGQEFIASKGSFHSEHANWMNKRYSKQCPNAQWPEGYTPVFEMICESVQHHVVHYGYEELYLLSLINVETGEEADYNTLYHWAKINGLRVPEILGLSLSDAVKHNLPNEEGYVATWLRSGQTPLRVKIKFIDFISLQRMLHHVRPKHILDAISQPHLRVYMDEWLNDSTPQFSAFVRKWKKALEARYQEIYQHSLSVFQVTHHQLSPGDASRKDYALEFTKDENRPYAPVLFAMLDQKEVQPVIWKLVEPMTKDGQPLCDEEV
jgi:putative RNA ligase